MASENPKVRFPLDVGTPGVKEWQEFGVQFSAARLLSLLLYQLDEVAPGFFEGVKEMFETAYDESDLLADDSEDWDSDWVTLRTPAYEYWTDRAGADELYRQLFPYSDKDIDLKHVGRGLVVVAFHSALEHYLTAISVNPTQGPLATRIERYLSKGSAALTADIHRELIVFDETRHVVVHHRGTVSEQYLRNVPYQKTFVAGDRRDITDAELWRFGDLVWDIANRIRAGG